MKAPQYTSLPGAQPRRTRSAGVTTAIALHGEVVTPILGGGAQTRSLDEVEIIRPATVRGHLRFWWRALRGHEFESPEELYNAESALWGGAAAEQVRRSAAEVRIEVEHAGAIDTSDIRPDDSKGGRGTPGAYALWPARSNPKREVPPAPRRKQGTRFRLTLIVPAEREAEVRNVVRAWILFGGYGSRTRRGLGTLQVVDDATTWLPKSTTRGDFKALFARDVFAATGKPATDVPWLAGASLQVGKVESNAVEAWTTALDWLKEFRQGTGGGAGNRAREPGTEKRPSISNWPEADKVRHLTNKTKGHKPRHDATPAWPRAGFGLPLIGQFQKSARDGGCYDEPDGFELRWRSRQREHDRLASPLIVKAMALADGTFVPCALWLNRACPNGEVVLRGANNSAAPFDRLVAPGDQTFFSALANKRSLREAFLDRLRDNYNTTVVAP